VSEVPASNYSAPRVVTTYGLRCRSNGGTAHCVRGAACALRLLQPGHREPLIRSGIVVIPSSPQWARAEATSFGRRPGAGIRGTDHFFFQVQGVCECSGMAIGQRALAALDPAECGGVEPGSVCDL
jgi:hypothetical protein